MQAERFENFSGEPSILKRGEKILVFLESSVTLHGSFLINIEVL